MIHLRQTVLGVIGTVVVAACGSTAPLAQSGAPVTEAGLGQPAGPAGTASPGGSTGGNIPAGGLPVGTTSGAGTLATPASGANGLSPGTSSGTRGAGQGGLGGSGPTTPIEVGLLITDTTAYTKETGVGQSQTDLERNSVHAFIDSINAEGGIAGRKLEVIDASVVVTAPDLNAAFQAACATFTQDHHVGAVIYDGVVYYDSFNACLTKAGVPLFSMAAAITGVGDITDFASNPGMIAPDSASLDRRLQSVLNKGLGAGFLRSSTKLGVFVEDCPYDLRAYARTFAPIVSRAKISVYRADSSCAQQGSDQATIVTDLQSAALKWKTANVDTVMFVSAFENGYVYYFAEGAEQQKYAPQYLLFRPQADAQSMSAFPQDQLVKMRGFGGTPLVNVTNPPAPPSPQAAARKLCLSIARSRGITPSSVNDQSTLFTACDSVFLLSKALKLTGGRAGTQNIVSAVERIGTTFVSTADLNGATMFGRARHDGTQLTAVSVYQSKCQCFVYSTRPSPIE